MGKVPGQSLTIYPSESRAGMDNSEQESFASAIAGVASENVLSSAEICKQTYIRRNLVRLIVSTLVGVGSLLGCDYVVPPITEALRNADAVFVGNVMKQKILPNTKRRRPRYEMHFSVSEQWKGVKAPE